MFGSKDSALCPHHARKELAAHRKGKSLVAKSLLRYVPDFSLAVSVNTFLSSVVRQYVLGNLDRKDAIALGYLAQIAATTLPAVDRQSAEERRVLASIDREQNIRENAAAGPGKARRLTMSTETENHKVSMAMLHAGK
jgi:hypothetical protein